MEAGEDGGLRGHRVRGVRWSRRRMVRFLLTTLGGEWVERLLVLPVRRKGMKLMSDGRQKPC